MHTKEEQFNRIIDIWHRVIEEHYEELRNELSELELSSLSACVGDCYESFYEIFFDSIEKIKSADSDDYGSLHENIADIFWNLDHIKNHIVDAEKGFTVLMDLLAKKVESKEKEG